MSADAEVSGEHRVAIEGWKARKKQLQVQQESVWQINDEAEKVNLLSFSKQMNKRNDN